MDIYSLAELIEGGSIEDAVAESAGLNPTAVFDNFDYHRVADDVKPYWLFAKGWFQTAGPLEKLAIARYVVDISTSEFAYLEIQGEAAAMLISSANAAAEFLAESLEGGSVLSGNPDAGLTKSQAQRLKETAAELRQVSIS